MKYFATVDGTEHRVTVIGPQEVEVDGRPYRVDLLSIDGGFHYSLLIGAASYEVFVEWCQGERVCFVMLEGRRYQVRLEPDRPGPSWRQDLGEPVRISEARVKSPMPGMVAAVLVRPGQAVRTGEGLMLLEAMKMENEIRAPMNGIVREVAVTPGQRIALDELLVRIELESDGAGEGGSKSRGPGEEQAIRP